MFSARLQNFRSLRDTGEISIRPITILLGRNSSGKSTFARFFPLLRQSVEVRSNTPLLWFGDLVDFGSIRSLRSRDSSDPVCFDLKFDLGALGRRYTSRNRTAIPPGTILSFGLTLDEHDDRTLVKAFRLGIGRDRIEIELGEDGEISAATLNDESYSHLLSRTNYKVDTTQLVPVLNESFDRAGEEIVLSVGSSRPAARRMRNYLKDRLHGNVTAESILDLTRRIEYRPTLGSFLRGLREIGFPAQSWADLLGHSDTPADPDLEHLRQLSLLRVLPSLLRTTNTELSQLFGRTGYIGPSRATGERYYRLQELQIEQIDPRGSNLAMFIGSLGNEERESFSEWTEDVFGFSVSTRMEPGHLSLLLRQEGSEMFNIADVGFGYSQLLPTLAQLWVAVRKASRRDASIHVFEQPELHLHPAYQSKIADALVFGVKQSMGSGKQLMTIVETHSQQLVNRLGELVERGAIEPNDVGIYVFEKKFGGETTDITAAAFDKDGTLVGWPHGFFSSE